MVPSGHQVGDSGSWSTSGTGASGSGIAVSWGHVEFVAKNIDVLATLIVLVSVASIGIEALRRRGKARTQEARAEHD
ncbi:hypothetical protein [Sinomonas soli]